MRDLLRFLGKSALGYFGLQVSRVPRSSDAGLGLVQGGDPVTCEYMPRLRGSAMFEIGVQESRGLFSLGLPLDPEVHPFALAAYAAARCAQADMADAIQRVLVEYYGQVRPSSALEAVDLDESEAPGLTRVPAEGWLFPWEDRTMAEVLRGRETAMRLDSLQYGKVLTFAEGITAFGPVGPGKLALEAERLRKLVVSVAENGFVFDRKNPMKVQGLRRDGCYRWILGEGNHRLAVCAAFGIASAPAIVTGVVRREDFRHWPQVVSGVFTAEGALKLFDRLYDGRPASACDAWLGERARRESRAGTLRLVNG